MRSTTVLRRLLGVTRMFVESALFRRDGTLVVDVRPTARQSRCRECGQVAPRYDRRYERGWRHLPWGRTSVELRYAPWRVECPQCGVRVEQVPWAPAGGRFSDRFGGSRIDLGEGRFSNGHVHTELTTVLDA